MRSGLAGMRVCRDGTVTDTDTLVQKGSTMLLFTLAAIIAALLFGGAFFVAYAMRLQENLRKCKRQTALLKGHRTLMEREIEILQADANRLALELEELESKANALDGRLAYALLEERKLRKMLHESAARELRASRERDLLLRAGLFRKKNGRFGKAKGLLDGRIIFQCGEGMMGWLLNE